MKIQWKRATSLTSSRFPGRFFVVVVVVNETAVVSMLFHSPFVFLLLFFFFQNFVRFRVERNTLESRLQKKSRFYRNQRTFDNLIFDNTKKKHSPFHFELCDRLTTHRKYSWLHFVVSMIKNRNGVVFLQRFTGRNIKKKTVLIFLQVLRQNSFELLL